MQRVVCLLGLLLPLLLPAQNAWRIQLLESGGLNPKTETTLLRTLKGTQDSLSIVEKLHDWVQAQTQKGYLECRWDSFQYVPHDKKLLLHAYQGPYYHLSTLQLEGLPEAYLQSAGLDRYISGKAPLQWARLEEKLAACIDLYQNEGFPFASFDQLSVDYRQRNEDTLLTEIHYQFEPGPLITIDSIYIKGNPRENERFIHALTRYYPGDAYNQERIDEIPRILNNSIYYERVSQPDISFTAYETAFMTLNLTRKKAGKFDILLGILPPQESQNGNSQRLQVTGTVDILLVSPLKQGEIIQLKFDKLTSSSQQTEVKLLLPFLFRTPLRLEGDFNLLKQEEDFLNLNAQAAGSYAFNPFLSARFYYRVRDTRLIGETLGDTSLLSLDQLDGNRQILGVGFRYEKLDYRYNPSEGWDAQVEVGIGRKEIRQNVRLRPEVYSSIPPVQNTQEIDLSMKWYYSPVRRQVIHLANRTYWLGLEKVLRNDQLQVGGARSIRGFNENRFFTDFYTFFTAEYRFQLERNSYLFGFVDYAWLRNRVDEEVLHPFGFGVGMNYGTQAGILSISYAIGQVEGTALQPSRGRIHIGLVNQF